VEIIEVLSNLHFGKRVNPWQPGISEFNDYAGDGVTIRLSQPLKNSVIPQPFKDFGPSCFGALIAIVEKADNRVIFPPAFIPALPERLVEKMLHYLI
jgi:hypothetical protein